MTNKFKETQWVAESDELAEKLEVFFEEVDHVAMAWCRANYSHGWMQPENMSTDNCTNLIWHLDLACGRMIDGVTEDNAKQHPQRVKMYRAMVQWREKVMRFLDTYETQPMVCKPLLSAKHATSKNVEKQ